VILKLTSSFLFFFSVLVIGSSSGCKSDDDPPVGAEQVTSSAATEAFVGCRPSAGECANSCPDRKGRFLVPDARCAAGDPREKGACVCGGTEEEPADPPPGRFAGCLPSASECRATCGGAGGGYISPYEPCPALGDPSHFVGGCFCNDGGEVR